MTAVGNYKEIKTGTMRSLRSAITRAKKRGDLDAVISICDKACEVFASHGRDASEFQKARDEASMGLALRHVRCNYG